MKPQFGTMRVGKDTREMTIEMIFPATLNDESTRVSRVIMSPDFRQGHPLAHEKQKLKIPAVVSAFSKYLCSPF